MYYVQRALTVFVFDQEDNSIHIIEFWTLNHIATTFFQRNWGFYDFVKKLDIITFVIVLSDLRSVFILE